MKPKHNNTARALVHFFSFAEILILIQDDDWTNLERIISASHYLLDNESPLTEVDTASTTTSRMDYIVIMIIIIKH